MFSFFNGKKNFYFSSDRKSPRWHNMGKGGDWQSFCAGSEGGSHLVWVLASQCPQILFLSIKGKTSWERFNWARRRLNTNGKGKREEIIKLYNSFLLRIVLTSFNLSMKWSKGLEKILKHRLAISKGEHCWESGLNHLSWRGIIGSVMKYKSISPKQ